MARGDESPNPATNSKVGRVIDEYELGDLGERLERYWTGEDGENRSLRELADYFNRQVLRAAMEETDINTLEGEVENTYRLLTDDEISGGMRTQARKSLQRQGLDVDRIETDFVSHQAIHTYLTKYRGAKHRPSEESSGDQLEKDTQTIRRLRSRTAAVTENTLERLSNTERITLGSFNVLIDIDVLCEDCGAQYTADELLERGGCDCSEST